MKKIIRIFPRRTSHTPKDDMAFIGDPPLFRPEADEIHISCTFTWDKPEAERLCRAWEQYYAEVYIGGPAYDDSGNGFSPGMYVKPGITYNMRGCNNQCPWCAMWWREGKARSIPISEGNIEQSNDLLQCEPNHIDAVFDMLSTQGMVVLAGIEAAKVNQRWSDRIRSLRLHQLFIAADTPEAIKPVRKALTMLSLPRDKVRCYILLKFNPNETISDATERMMKVWNAGAIPFAQLYQPFDHTIEYPREWRQFARTFQRPAATKAFMKGLK